MNRFVLGILSSVIVVTEQSNCSTDNPCGIYGYCRDDSDGNWTCECKFWWNGTRCDQQTNSGIQVITIGCLLAFTMIILYGLTIARCIHNRRLKAKEKKIQTKIKTSNSINVIVRTAYQSVRLSSCSIPLFMIIIASAALVGYWSIIQSIHDEIVYNVMNFQQWNILTFSVACFLIFLFITQTKRTSLSVNKCSGYGGPPIPVDFLSHRDRKFAAVVFAICADELLSIMEEAISGSPRNSPKGDGVIVVYLLRVLRVIVMGFRYYPLLAAVYIDSIFTLACGTFYAWFDYAATIVNMGMCQADYYPTYDDYLANASNINTMFYFYGTGSNLIAIQLCTDIPRFLCLAYISVKLPALLIKKIYLQRKKSIPIEEKISQRLTREQRTFFYINRPSSVEMLYVKNLFHSAEQRPRTQSLFGRLIPIAIYEWRDDFRFSARVLCVYSSIALLLYFLAVKAFILVLPRLVAVEKSLQQVLNAFTPLLLPSSDVTMDNGNPEDVNSNTSDFPVPPLTKPYIIAVFLTLAIIIIQLTVLLVNMRRNLFQSFRGNDSELPRRKRSKYTELAVGNVHFAGYFIGYLVWGFILIAVFSALICISIQSLISFGSVRLIESVLRAIIPTLLLIMFKQYLNRVIAQYVFLQHHGEVLALNNRRALMIFIYFNFFLDAFLGFVSSVVRLLQSVIGGILYMCRLDYSPLGRKLETIDGGFSAYCGFIHTECQHRHPVMLVFVSHLYTQMKIRQLTFENMDMDDVKRKKSSSRYVRKWKLAVFLIQNPAAIFFRKAFLINNKDRNNVDIHRTSTAKWSIGSDSAIEYFKTRRF